MNGRTVLAASVATAVVVAWAFAAEVLAPSAVSMPEGNELCMSSRNSDDYLVSVDFTNDGRKPVILTGARADSLDGIQLLETFVVSPEFGSGFGAVSYTREAIDDWSLTDVAGTEVDPGERAQVVYRLKSTSGGGLATDFAVTFTDRYGLSHSASSPFAAGFYSGEPQSDVEIPCGI